MYEQLRPYLSRDGQNWDKAYKETIYYGTKEEKRYKKITHVHAAYTADVAYCFVVWYRSLRRRNLAMRLKGMKPPQTFRHFMNDNE